VVEDDPQVLRLFAEALARVGCEVVSCSSVAEANLRIESDGADVMVLDLRLRDGHGLEVLRRLPDTLLELDLRDLVALAGDGFEDGSIRVTYLGQNMALGGMLRMTDAGRGHEFDEQLMYPVADKSNRLDAVWWLPDEATEARVVVTNVTGSTVTADIRIDSSDATHLDSTVVTLKPWELTVVDLAATARRVKVAGEASARFGGASITYTGQPGAIMARGFVANSRRFSTVIPFSDKASARTSSVEGAGVRVSLPDGALLAPLILARRRSHRPGPDGGSGRDRCLDDGGATRPVSIGGGQWKYVITKPTGGDATYSPLPSEQLVSIFVRPGLTHSTGLVQLR
jgi:CheY-like chemotaxis protein